MKIEELLILVLFVTWGVLNVIYVVFNKALAKYISRVDIFKWVSAYQLFSEKSSCFKLEFRDRVNTDLTEWKAINFDEDYKWYHFIWFPNGLKSRMIMSLLDDFVVLYQQSTEKSTRKLSKKFLHQTVLAYIFSHSTSKNLERQFKIIEVNMESGTYTSNEVFISDFYKTSEL